jgi:hypothetical protein
MGWPESKPMNVLGGENDILSLEEDSKIIE